MSAPAPICTHIKTDGVRCGSPALRGTALCFHHTAVKTALGKVTPLEKVGYGSFHPIPFVFPEDRAAMQINYFLLLQALNEQRVEKRAADLMLRMLKAMDKNLGKSGSLVDAESASQRADGASESAGQPVSNEASGRDTATHVSSRHGAPAPGDVAGEDAALDELTAYVHQKIDEVNAAASGSDRRSYADYREVTALHPAGQRVLNMYCQPLMDR